MSAARTSGCLEKIFHELFEPFQRIIALVLYFVAVSPFVIAGSKDEWILGFLELISSVIESFVGARRGLKCARVNVPPT